MLRLTTDRHKALRGLSATAELLVYVYPSKTSGMASREPDMMNTAELIVLTVAVNITVWTTGPKNPTTAWKL